MSFKCMIVSADGFVTKILQLDTQPVIIRTDTFRHQKPPLQPAKVGQRIYDYDEDVEGVRIYRERI